MMPRLQKYFLVLSFLLSTIAATAQTTPTGRINGFVTDDQTAIAFTTVVLKNSADSSFVKAEITSDDGLFNFKNIAYGSYFLEVSYIGMQGYRSKVFDLAQSTFTFPPIIMVPDANDLSTIEVVAKRPLIEVLADRTVFNVENTLNSTGTNGFELLRKAPGVIIDNNDNVILDGKTGVLIFINGKPSPLSGEDLTNFLSGLQSSDIDKIEIITQPSSKYDAAGNAGIINIILKKDKRLGTNGTASAGYAYGRNSRYNSSLSLNNRTASSNWFANYSNSFGDTWSFINLDRIQGDTRFDSRSETIRSVKAHNVRAGYDYFLKDKHTFGFLVNGNFFQRDNDGFTNTPIIPNGTGAANQTLKARNIGVNESTNLAGNVNYLFSDTLGHELLVDFDYGRYQRDQNSYQPNLYLDGNDFKLFEVNFRMITPTNIDILTSKIDYSQNLLGGKFGIGGKYALVRTDNTFNFYDVIGENDIYNTNRSNQFKYTENINAFYFNFNKKIKKWSFQVGLRLEQTISEGDLISNQTTPEDNVKRNYLDWFPSAGLTYAPNFSNSWALLYSRRIQRPDYQSLNPFEYQMDELSFSKGNPFLQPQYTNNVKLSHTYKYRLTTSISYSYIQDFFAKVTETLGDRRNFLITRNIANQEVINLGITYPFDVNKWWGVYMSLNAFHASYQGSDDKFVTVDQNTFSMYAQNTFKLPKGFRFEVSGWFSSPSVWGGTYLTQSMGSLDLAVQKKFLDDKLTLRVAASDVLFTSFWRADMQFGDLYIDGNGGWESRQVKVNLSYRFGRNEIKKSRNRKTGLEEEGKRISN